MVDESKAWLFKDTGFAKTTKDTKSLIVGIIMAVVITLPKSQIDEVLQISPNSEPYIFIKEDLVKHPLKSKVSDFNRYIQTVISANNKLIPLSDKAKRLSQEAPELPKKIKEELRNCDSLDSLEGIGETKQITASLKQAIRLPQFISEVILELK